MVIPVTTKGLEVAPESWKDFLLDVAQQSAANEISRSKHQSPRPRRWVIEAYREGYHGIELVLAVRVGVGEPAYLRAVIIGTGVEHSWGDFAEPSEALDTDNGDQQFTVLVADVELVEDRKFVVRWLRSLVWLHLIEDFPQRLGDTRSDLGEGATPMISRGQDFEDGECRDILRPRRTAGRDDQLPSEMIKRDAKVMDGVANDRDQEGRHGGYPVEPKDVLGSLFVALSDNGLSTRCLNTFGSTVKVVQMGFCAIDLEEHA